MKRKVIIVFSLLTGLGTAEAATNATGKEVLRLRGACQSALTKAGNGADEARESCRPVRTKAELACVAKKAKDGDNEYSTCFRAPTKKGHRRGRRGEGSSESYTYTYGSGSSESDSSPKSDTVLIISPNGGAPTVGIDTGGGVVIPTNGGAPFVGVGAGNGIVIAPAH